MCSPTKAGKTTSILPAFLESDFTHYLYLAFDNNAEQRFEVAPRSQRSVFFLFCSVLPSSA